MKEMKLALFLALILEAGLYAQTVPEGLEHRFTEGGGLTITGYSGGAATLSIPSRIRDYLVISIRDRAFERCEGLTRVDIPNSVTTIGRFVFSRCEGLTSIQVDERNPRYASIEGVLFNKDRTILIQYPIGREDAAYTIPSSVSAVEEYAFEGCSRLTSVVIPDSVSAIGSFAFSWCNGLTSVVIPNSVSTIDDYAFTECRNLKSVTLSRKTRLGYAAFPSGVRITYRD